MARVFAQAQDRQPQSALAAANVTSDLDTLPKIGAPATRALASAGYTSLRQLAGVSRSELDKLHGMGPKALGILQAALAEHGLSLG
jgi:predicted flap endonuclease-1-like 5' DNA nuclease